MTPLAMISPVILELGPLSLRWYGVLTALGALAAYLLVSRRLAGTAVKESKLGDIAIIAILSAIVGARLFYVIRFWNTDFAHRPLSAALKVWEGGLVFQGGFIVPALALIAYALWQVRLVVAVFAAMTLISGKRQRHHQQDSHVGRANSR